MLSIQNTLIAGALAVVLGFGAGWVSNGWRLNGEISDIKAQQATDEATKAQTAVDDLVTASKTIKDAAESYTGIQTKLGSKIDKLREEFKNAPPPPLPADCKPDATRMRKLTGAIDAANQAISGQ